MIASTATVFPLFTKRNKGMLRGAWTQEDLTNSRFCLPRMSKAPDDEPMDSAVRSKPCRLTIAPAMSSLPLPQADGTPKIERRSVRYIGTMEAAAAAQRRETPMKNFCACRDNECNCKRTVSQPGRTCGRCTDGDHRYEDLLEEAG